MSELDAIFRQFTGFFMPEKCHNILFTDYDIGTFLAGECVKFAVSKVLGYAIIAGAVLVKVPQIMAMLKQKSSEGISFMATALDFILIADTLAYGYYKNFSFASYGDSLPMFLQTAAIWILIPLLSGKKGSAFLTFSICAVLAYAGYTKMIPFEYIDLLNKGQVPVVVLSRGLQAFSNLKAGHTKSLSFVSTDIICKKI